MRREMISDVEKQNMLDMMVEKGLDVDGLNGEQFDALLDALARMYNARIMNCVDPTMKKDREWRTLSNVFRRVIRERKSEGVL